MTWWKSMLALARNSRAPLPESEPIEAASSARPRLSVIDFDVALKRCFDLSYLKNCADRALNLTIASCLFDTDHGMQIGDCQSYVRFFVSSGYNDVKLILTVHIDDCAKSSTKFVSVANFATRLAALIDDDCIIDDGSAVPYSWLLVDRFGNIESVTEDDYKFELRR